MPRAHIGLDRQAVIAPVRRRTFGSFIEHLGAAVLLFAPAAIEARQDVVS